MGGERGPRFHSLRGHSMITVLEYVWEQEPQSVLELVRRRYLDWEWVRDVLIKGARLFLGIVEHEDYAVLMQHSAYRRVKGALRQVRWE